MKIKRHGQGSTINLKQRFFLWSAIILLGGGLLLLSVSFWNTRRLLMADSMTKSEVLLREVEAIRSYVNEELRPKMYELHGQDTFIIEAMSTTYISTTIMARFAKTMPEYIYRRVSLSPHNPRNLADPFEEEMFDWFEVDSSRLFWQASLLLFGITLSGSLVLLWLLNLLFQRLVIERLEVMISLMAEKKKESDGPPGLGDELDVLHASLGSLHSYVRSARKGSSLQPNLIRDYVVSKPIAAGAMSWLYNGYGVKSDDKVSIKIGFDEVLQNPLYRACFETELHLFETMSHPCLPEVRERMEDVLVFAEVQGRSLLSFLNKID